MYRPDMASAPGSVSQVRECASLLMRMAKTTGCAVFLVGHVTKEGAIAGPRVLEHMVDVVLYFEGDRQHEYRILRAVKNRFGSVNELGLFEMHERGMVPVENPSELLLSTRARNVPGSCVHCAIEGSRPMLVDVQALALQTAYGTPRRTTNGFDAGRLALLLAVLEKRAGVSLFNQDVYINVAGGLELSEPAADLPLCAAVASSVRDACVPGDWAVIGEVGLAGDWASQPPSSRAKTPSTCARRRACGSTAWKRWPRRWPSCSDERHQVRKGLFSPFGVENSFLSTVWASLSEGGVTP
jgi:DNA repair protein RadA/Sms